MSDPAATVRRMDGEPEQVVDGWSRGEPGSPDYEEVQIVENAGRLRVRLVGAVTAPDLKATNQSHAIALATRLMLREWRRRRPAQVPVQRFGRRVVR